MWVRVRPQRLPREITGLILCVVYHPPSSPYDTLLIEHLSNSLDILQSKYPDAGIGLLGDFNQLDTDLICHLSGLVPVVNSPTGHLR